VVRRVLFYLGVPASSRFVHRPFARSNPAKQYSDGYAKRGRRIFQQRCRCLPHASDGRRQAIWARFV